VCGVGEGDTAHHRFDRERDAAVRNVTFANHVGTLGSRDGSHRNEFLLKNVGKRACELDGFPTVQMIGAPRTWSHGSHVRADYTVPFVAPRITRIKPGGTAVFMLGYADMTATALPSVRGAHASNNAAG